MTFKSPKNTFKSPKMYNNTKNWSWRFESLRSINSTISDVMVVHAETTFHMMKR